MNTGSLNFGSLINKNIPIEVKIDSNNYIMAPISEIKEVFSISINNLNGETNYIILAKYDKDGKEYIFKSKKLKANPSNNGLTNEVKVYVDDKNYKKYLVDINDYIQV